MESEPDEHMFSFATQLCKTDRGLVMAANMVDSCTGDRPLIRAEFLRQFAQECVEAASVGMADADFVSLIDKVSIGAGPSRRGRLRSSRCRQLPKVEEIGTVLKCETFHRFLLSKAYKEDDELPEALPLVPRSSASGADEYRDALERITANANWCEDAAALGRPYPDAANCWVSTDHFGPDGEAPVYDKDKGEATRRRDELGLSHYRSGANLLRVRVPTTSISQLAGVEIARPVFSDGGNPHFVVAQRSPRAQLFAESGWGATLHLGKLRAGPMGCVAGAPELVTSPLKVKELGSVAIEYLGEVSIPPPGDPPDAGKTVRPLVLGERTPDVILKELLRLLQVANP